MKDTFGLYLNKLLKKSGVTQKALSEALGYAKPYVNQIISGNSVPFSKQENYDEIEKLLSLSEQEKCRLMDLAAKERNEVPVDVFNYLQKHSDAILAIRKMIKGENNV